MKIYAPAIANVADPVVTRSRAPQISEALPSFEPAKGTVLGLRAEATANGVAGEARPARIAWIRQELAAGRVGGAEDIDRAARAMFEELR